MRDIFFPKTITIRIPSFVARMISAEVSKRNFFKPNGQGNENEFFNKMLPNMIAYRAYKKGFLRDYLDKNVKSCIPEKMQEKILDFLAESFDYLYFDESEYECDNVINLRFDVKNEDLYANLFVRLDNIGIKRSSYLRNLIHEYFNQSEYQKERVCFNEEYVKLSEAMENEFIFQFQNEENVYTAFAISLEYSIRSEHWYLLYFEEGNFNTLYSTPLYKIKNILIKNKSNIDPPISISNKVHAIIDSGEFDNAESFILGEHDHA